MESEEDALHDREAEVIDELDGEEIGNSETTTPHTKHTHYTPHSTFRAVREYARGRNRSRAARNQVRVVGAEVKFKN